MALYQNVTGVFFCKSIWQLLVSWQQFRDFEVLNFVGVPQFKPMHGFSPSYHDMFNPRGSRAEICFGAYLVEMATLSYFWP